jgi:hypothetical protein
MNIEQQMYFVHAMSGKNTHMVNPNTINGSKNIRTAHNVSSIDFNSTPSPANQPIGTVDGSIPVEGTDIGIKY